MTVTVAYDVTHDNLPSAPKGAQLAGYLTGSGGIAWTPDDWAAHPGAVRIDQDASATQPTADVLDVEAGAVPAGSPRVADWARLALADYASAAHPGQRRPAIYCSASNVTANANALEAGGVKSGIGLWVANWNLTDPQAVSEVNAASGPYPIIGIQYKNDGPFDIDVFSTAWLAEVSKKAASQPSPVAPVPPPASGTQDRWRWCSKCKGLFYGPDADSSHCPAGGPHDMTGSYSYSMAWTRP